MLYMDPLVENLQIVTCLALSGLPLLLNLILAPLDSSFNVVLVVFHNMVTFWHNLVEGSRTIKGTDILSNFVFKLNLCDYL